MFRSRLWSDFIWPFFIGAAIGVTVGLAMWEVHPW